MHLAISVDILDQATKCHTTKVETIRLDCVHIWFIQECHLLHTRIHYAYMVYLLTSV